MSYFKKILVLAALVNYLAIFRLVYSKKQAILFFLLSTYKILIKIKHICCFVTFKTKLNKVYVYMIRKFVYHLSSIYSTMFFKNVCWELLNAPLQNDRIFLRIVNFSFIFKANYLQSFNYKLIDHNNTAIERKHCAFKNLQFHDRAIELYMFKRPVIHWFITKIRIKRKTLYCTCMAVKLIHLFFLFLNYRQNPWQYSHKAKFSVSHMQHKIPFYLYMIFSSGLG